jgi:hypothetical protein
MLSARDTPEGGTRERDRLKTGLRAKKTRQPTWEFENSTDRGRTSVNTASSPCYIKADFAGTVKIELYPIRQGQAQIKLFMMSQFQNPVSANLRFDKTGSIDQRIESLWRNSPGEWH